MRLDLLDVIVCPGCRFHPLRREMFEPRPGASRPDGVIVCPGCGRWYPIEDGLVELLVEALAYTADRERFRDQHADQLHLLGLDHGGEPASAVERADEILHQQQHFDWYADNTQQTWLDFEQLGCVQALDSIVMDKWRRRILPGTRLLDIGCAQGRSTFLVIRPDIDVVGFDISKALVREAVDRADAEARVTFLVADATSMPFVDESFDYAQTVGVLHHLPAPNRVCGEVSRVLKSKGIFFAAENNRSILRPVFDLLQRLRPLWHEEAGEYAQMSSKELADWLREAGLSPSIRTSVFVPPHALNHVSRPVAERILNSTDKAAHAIPGLRGNGGLLLAEAVKVGNTKHHLVAERDRGER
jgi:SAM-dependent methyltransferase/uncharacterized protein YbaR (Trm112 family)